MGTAPRSTLYSSEFQLSMQLANNPQNSGTPSVSVAARGHTKMDMPRRALRTNRRLYLCTYDVADDMRRTRLFESLKDHGEHIQFSVFLCELSDMEQAKLVSISKEILHHTEDQLLILDVGPADFDLTLNLTCIGKSWSPQVRCHII